MEAMSRVSPLSSFGPGNRTVIISRDTAVLFHHESSPRGQSVLLREEQADVHRRVFAGDCQAADPPPPRGLCRCEVSMKAVSAAHLTWAAPSIRQQQSLVPQNEIKYIVIFHVQFAPLYATEFCIETGSK